MCEERLHFIEELNNFIGSSKLKFNNLLQTVNWTRESLHLSKELDPCSSEQIKCGLADGNILKDEWTSNTGLNNEKGGVDRIYDELVASLQVDETSLKMERKTENVENKAAALAQLLKLERDAKRRRISYKNRVHTKNKSHTEVLREVLEEQMLTITGGIMSNNGTCSNTALRSDTEQTSELIAIRPPQGNPYTAWLTILKDEKNKGCHQKKLEVDSSDHHRRHFSSVNKDHKSKERKDWRKKGESDGRHRDKDKRKKSGYEDRERERDHSPRHKEIHHKKKRRRRSTSSPRDGYSKHKTKNKKKNH